MTEHVIYILSGQDKGPIFMGVTTDLPRCIRRHRAGKVSRAEFRIDRLVYTESFGCSYQADARLRALKGASREWLYALITASNPAWENCDVHANANLLIKIPKAA